MEEQLDFIEGVLRFNRAAGRTEHAWNSRAIGLHLGLQMEELAEKLDAILKAVPAADLQWLRAHLDSYGTSFKRGDYDHQIEWADREDFLDADIDIAVVTIGSMQAQGAQVQAACAEVNRANLAKLVGGKALMNENNKIIKPEGWTPPDLTPFVCQD